MCKLDSVNNFPLPAASTAGSANVGLGVLEGYDRLEEEEETCYFLGFFFPEVWLWSCDTMNSL